MEIKDKTVFDAVQNLSKAADDYLQECALWIIKIEDEIIEAYVGPKSYARAKAQEYGEDAELVWIMSGPDLEKRIFK